MHAKTTIYLNVALDLIAIVAISSQVIISGAFSNVPDAGLSLIIYIPIIAVLIIDIFALVMLSKRLQKQPLMIYFGLTRLALIYFVHRLLVNSPLAMSGAVVLGLLAIGGASIIAVDRSKEF